MNLDQKYEKALLSFKENIKYQNRNVDKVSVLLFRTYLTNLFHLKKRLGNESEFLKNPDIHNIFLDIKPSWINELKDLNSFYNDLRKYDIKFSTGRFLDGFFIYLSQNFPTPHA